MRILFVNTTVGIFSPKFNPAIAILSALARSRGHRTSLLLVRDRISRWRIARTLLRVRPHVVAFSCTTSQWPAVRTIGAFVKRWSGARTLVGGVHPTLVPDEVLADPWVDAVCVGEGEEAFAEYLDAVSAGQPIDSIQNLHVRGADGRIHRNPIRPASEDLDSLPFWDLDLFGLERFRQANDYGFLGRPGFFPFLAGRGCPFRCTYCCNRNLLDLYGSGKGPFVRKRSLDSIIDELRILKDQHGAAGIEFWDEMLVPSEAWAEAFSDRYAREVALPFTLAIRPERATRPVLEHLRAAGCDMVMMGVECADEAFRRRVLNRTMTNARIEEAFSDCRELGIKTLAWNMIGLPGETAEMIRGTIDLNRRLRPNVVGFAVFDPLPMTELRALCEREGLLTDREVPIHSDRSRLDQPTLSQEELSACFAEFAELAEAIQTEAMDWQRDDS